MSDLHVLRQFRAADGGAKLILSIEHTAADTPPDAPCEKETLTVISTRVAPHIAAGVLDEELYAFLRHEAEYCEAVDIGLRSLGAGLESRAKLLAKLRARGVSSAVAREVAEELARRGYLDELAGAVREAERGLAKYWGDRRILADLTAKGYPVTAVRAAEKRLAEEDSVKRLRALLHKRRVRAPRDRAEAARLVASLARFGYSQAEIRAALQDT